MGHRRASGGAAAEQLRERLVGSNEVVLLGRVSGPAVARSLPSGDEVVQLRVVVRRPPARRGASGTATGVDTIDLACWTAALRRKALALEDGAIIRVEGALRRRFWRSPAGPVSRYEVEVSSLGRRRVAHAEPEPSDGPRHPAAHSTAHRSPLAAKDRSG